MGASLSYINHTRKKRERILKKKILLEEIETIEAMCNIDVEHLERKKSKLEKLRKEKLQGHIIRPRAKWVEEGEKPSKYF